MATFNNFTNILPDPTYGISYSGDSSASQTGFTLGPGYASVKFKSNQPYLKHLTNSGRLIARTVAAQKWEIEITYNPMTREDFEPIYTFLLQRQGPLNPFFVSLPQYEIPKNSSFATYSQTNNLTPDSSYAAGELIFMLEKVGYAPEGASGIPTPGDLFNIDSTTYSNHKKTYMVTRVETASTYQSGTAAPSSTQVKVHFIPSLQKSVVASDEIIFYKPLIKVVLDSEIQEYSLNTNNLYTFSLKLQEVQ